MNDEVEKSVNLAGLKYSLMRIRNAFDKPLLIKNMNCALRMQSLAKVVPNALFIVTHRDMAEMGHSLLEVRKKIHGDYQTWWSMEPSNIDILKTLSPAEQVVGQCQQIYADIEEGKKWFKPSQFCEVDYDALCERPMECMGKIAAWIEDYGVKRREDWDSLPNKFEKRQEVRIPQDLWDALQVQVDG